MINTRLILIGILAGCAGPTRFADRAILWHDHDDGPSPLPPTRRNAQIRWEGARDGFFRATDRALSIDYVKEARNVNALDEVPDSSWFVDRRRDPAAPDDQPRWLPLAPETIARGAVRDEDLPVLPFTIIEGKSVGSAHGFVVLDSRNVRYMLKLDPPDLPQLVTSTQVVANRLAWAAGWNVPAEMLLDVAPETLLLAHDATIRNAYDRRVPFTEANLSQLLRGQVRDGKVRVLASRWIGGRILGWGDYQGRDKHDRNDRIKHEDRRDLRGFGIWTAWVDDVDTLENNTLDTYVGEPGTGHVVHYQQDVGKSFGVFATKPISYWMGQESYFAGGRIFASLGTLGLMPRPWMRMNEATRVQTVERWPQLGFFDAEHFKPRRWQPVVANAAFARQTRRDRFWGAKRVVLFTPDELRAAIAVGRYPSAVAEHLFDVLWQRREKVARAYFADTAPLDSFRLDGDRLCFEDLGIRAGLGEPGTPLYDARERGKLLPFVSVGCVQLGPAQGYRVIELRVRRPGERHLGPAVRVHLVAHTTRRNIVGIER
jgi:hypothetical protein